jgi:hypothetical protein
MSNREEPHPLQSDAAIKLNLIKINALMSYFFFEKKICTTEQLYE